MATRYVIALGAVAGAWLVRVWLGAWLGLSVPYLQFFAAIMVAGWAGGFGPGLLATVLSSAVANYFFLEPTRSFALSHTSDQVSFPFFVLIGIGISWLNESRRRAEAAQRQVAAQASARAAELDRANRAKDEFLATISHELRTPLAAILGWCHLMRKGAQTVERMNAGLAAIERSARTQRRLVDDLIDMAGIAQGKLQIEMAPTDLDSVIDAAVELVRPAALRKGVGLVRVGGGDGRMQGDAQRLQQIVSNLVANAVKFTPTGGTVTIALLTSPATLEIVVHDTGEGIHADLMPHIFEPFRQGDGSPTRRHPGIGLGLTIVQHLVHGHGGTVHVDSEGAGRGATFRVVIPRAVGADAAAGSAQSARRAG